VPDNREAIVLFDPGFIIVGWEGAAEALFQWTAVEAVGRKVWEVIPSDADRPERIATLIRRGEWSGVVVLARKDGEQVAVEARVTCQRNAAGSITSYRSAVRELPEPAIFRWYNTPDEFHR
jgi:PAS domain S-box-containing protein